MDAVEVEAAWAELNLRLQRSKGLCLVFLHADETAALALLRIRVDDAWSWRTAPLRLLRPQASADAAAEVLRVLQQEVHDHPAVRSPVWIELLDIDAAEADAWEQARAEVLSRLNEWRSWLQNEFRRPLMVSLPVAWRRLVVEAAPDLWQVRAWSVVVGQPGRVEQRGTASASEGLIEPMAAGQATAAVEAAQRTVEQRREAAVDRAPEALRGLSAALIDLGDVQREVGQSAQALASYRESLELRRELRRALGDAPGVLRDLSVSLERLGDAQREAGQGAQALASYRESLELRRELRRALGDAPRVLDDLAVSLERLAAVPLASSDTDPAERHAWIDEALGHRRRLVQAFPDDPRWQRRLAAAERLKKQILED